MAIRALGLGFVLSHEDPTLSGVVTTDSGLRTRYGISEKSFPAFWANGRQPTLDDMNAVFLVQFWIPLGCDHIQDQDLANRLVDAGFPMGMRTAARLLQTAINTMWESKKVEVDGQIGESTLQWATSYGLLAFFRKELENHYRSIAANNPSEAKYLNGWLTRIA